MNILVIGNGFDLAHKLPTKYQDFLEFVEYFKCNFIAYFSYCFNPIIKSDLS